MIEKELGVERDVLDKTSSCLVPWSKLPDDMKKLNRDSVRRIPEFLANEGYEVRRAP